MPTLLCDLARVFDDSSVRVDKLRLSSSCRLSDGSMNVTVYGNDVCFVFYMLRNMKKNTLHRIVGSVSINAYISQNANRANYAARIGPESIEPLTLRDQVARLNAQTVTNDMQVTNKLSFITRLYILQQWDEPIIRGAAGDKVIFAQEVLRLQQALVTDGLLPPDVIPCCSIESIAVTTTARLRPTQIRNEETVILNANFATIHLLSYRLSELLNDVDALILTDAIA